MNQVKDFKRGAFIATIILTMVCGLLFNADIANAASGKFGGCSISRNYRHPVTGIIEDSGGESGYATGQGMVESIGYSYGLVEKTVDGKVYVTVRLTMQNMISNVSFKSQTRGGSGWSALGTSITNNGSDGNGTTKDYCIRVASQNSIIKCSMYVEPMGRQVIFFLSPSGFSEGNNNGMAVTHISKSEENANNSNSSLNSNSNSNGGNNIKEHQSNVNTNDKKVEHKPKTKEEIIKAIKEVEKKIDAIGKVTIEKENLINEARMAYDILTVEQQKKVKNASILKMAEKKLLELKAYEIETPNVEKTLNSAKGLTLSTEEEQLIGNSSTVAIILGSIVLIVFVGSAGYYVIQRKKKGTGDTRDDDQ